MTETAQGLKEATVKDKEAEDARKSVAAHEFAREIVRLREKAGISQKRLGAIIGIEQAIISRIELANYGISLDLVYRLARAFNDNPHRLADIYWGNDPMIYNAADKELIDNIWTLMLNYFKPDQIPPLKMFPQPQPQPNPPLTPGEVAEVARYDQLHDKQTQTRKKRQPAKNQTDLNINEP